jgi:hypothetical protein
MRPPVVMLLKLWLHSQQSVLVSDCVALTRLFFEKLQRAIRLRPILLRQSSFAKATEDRGYGGQD